MTDLSVRLHAEEQMDAADLPDGDYAALLGDLARVNALTMASRPTIAFLDRVARVSSTIKVLDVGSGHGDMLRRIARWAHRKDVTVHLVGIDVNQRSAPIAQAATDPTLPIDFRTGSYQDLAGEGWDVVISSLVAHHMSATQLAEFIGFMETEARLGWLVNDLHRHRLAYIGFPLLARLAGWHRIVREDGTLSIARAYRPKEWQQILAEAGSSDARVYCAFPFRLCVERLR